MGDLCFVSLFPEYFETVMNVSILGRAVAQGQIHYQTIQIRDFSQQKHQRVDDAPYGGGPGQVMQVEPLVLAIEAARRACPDGHVIMMSPSGRPFTQADALRLSRLNRGLIFVCGHYEGVDDRVLGYVDEELSIGDYVLTGGELAAAVVSDAVCRLWPNVVGNQASVEEESFSAGWLEYPQYTRPQTYRGVSVPEVLLGGNHEAVRVWRRCESIRRTYERRRDIFDARVGELTRAELRSLGLVEPEPETHSHKKGKQRSPSREGET